MVFSCEFRHFKNSVATCIEVTTENVMFGLQSLYERNPNNAPAATAEPMTPATLGPMACISRKL